MSITDEWRACRYETEVRQLRMWSVWYVSLVSITRPPRSHSITTAGSASTRHVMLRRRPDHAYAVVWWFNANLGPTETRHITNHHRHFYYKLEIRSVEHSICPIAKSTMNELFLKLWLNALCMHEMAIFPCHCRISQPRFPTRCENLSNSHKIMADIRLLNICMDFQDLLA